MKQVFVRYAADETVPVARHLKNRKLQKYFNRETAAAVTAMGLLREKHAFDTEEMPIYYATGMLAYEDYGLRSIVSGSTENGKFSLSQFISRGLTDVSPLSQFKILQNMPLCFVSIAFGFRGDNAVVYSSGRTLLMHGSVAPGNTVVLGAGKTYSDGAVEAGFALMSKSELRLLRDGVDDGEAISLFRPGGGCGK